jgi:hypothetical protein
VGRSREENLKGLPPVHASTRSRLLANDTRDASTRPDAQATRQRAAARGAVRHGAGRRVRHDSESPCEPAANRATASQVPTVPRRIDRLPRGLGGRCSVGTTHRIFRSTSHVPDGCRCMDCPCRAWRATEPRSLSPLPHPRLHPMHRRARSSAWRCTSASASDDIERFRASPCVRERRRYAAPYLRLHTPTARDKRLGPPVAGLRQLAGTVRARRRRRRTARPPTRIGASDGVFWSSVLRPTSACMTGDGNVNVDWRCATPSTTTNGTPPAPHASPNDTGD